MAKNEKDLSVKTNSATLQAIKQSYRTSQESAAAEIVLLMGQQYRMQITPAMTDAWVRALVEEKKLSPQQIRQGYVAYISDPQVCSFPPQPGAIAGYCESVEAKDKPRVKAREDCRQCDGTSWRKMEGSNRVTRCDCRVLVYGEQQAQLPAGNPEQDRKLLSGIVKDAKVERRNMAVMPRKIREVNFAPPMTDEELDRQKEILRKKYGV